MNEEAKRNILRKIPYGLYVIGVKDGKGHHAFTASWFSQSSMKPPRIMMGVRAGSRSHDLLKEGKVFSVNFVSKTDHKVLEQFFKTTPSSGNRFGELSYTTKKTGTPILDKAVAYLECEVKHFLEDGDHSVVIAEVVGAEVLKEEAPLIMSDTPWHYGG